MTVVAAALFPPVSSAQADTCATGEFTFASVDAERCYTVPAGVTQIHVAAVGAPGGAPGGLGAFGATATGDFAVTPGETLYIEVGGPGTFSTGGFNGGGAGVNGLGGGGASDMRTCSIALTCPALGSPQDPRLIVAGGGGGAGGTANSAGGAGGNAGITPQAGANGTDVDANATAGGGAGGATQIAGGTAGAAGFGTLPNGVAGSPGQAGAGGAGGESGGGGGGGGGGGLYGGGGGGGGGRNAGGQRAGGGGGGGGSSFVPSGGAIGTDATGTPSVAITITPPNPVASPASLTFGPQALGSASPSQTVTIANDNNGGSPFLVEGFGFSGPAADDYFFGSFNGCFTLVTAESSCALQVRFLPQALGPRHAVLEISTDASPTPLSVALTGSGGKCVVPNVKGRKLRAAKRAITGTEGCVVGHVSRKKSRKRAGTVLKQSPAPGTTGPAGTKVNLVVARK